MMLTPEEALKIVLDATPQLEPAAVSPNDALGRVLAQDVCADRAYPPFDRSMMDGFAVRVSDAGKTIPVVGEVAAGTTFDDTLPTGACVAIMTGAPCPSGTEAVVQKEHVHLSDGAAELPATIAPDRNIVRTGSECARGAVIVERGARATPLHRALMESFGLESVSVIPQAAATVIGTGSELVSDSAAPGVAQIRSSNAPVLGDFIQAAGADCLAYRTAGDTLEAIAEAFEGASEGNVVISTGGVSVGTYDLVPKALESLGAKIHFHGVEQRPGKPMLFATYRNQLVFGLSGNPMACIVGFNIYVLPALRTLMGFAPPSPRFSGVLTSAIKGRGTFTWFATGLAEHVDGGCRVTPHVGRGAADMFTTASANALIYVPPGAELAAGAPVTFQPMPGCHF